MALYALWFNIIWHHNKQVRRDYWYNWFQGNIIYFVFIRLNICDTESSSLIRLDWYYNLVWNNLVSTRERTVNAVVVGWQDLLMFPAWNDDGIGTICKYLLVVRGGWWLVAGGSHYEWYGLWAWDILSLFARAPVSRVMGRIRFE